MLSDEYERHTDVIGDKKNDPEIRVKLKRISSWVSGYTIP